MHDQMVNLSSRTLFMSLQKEGRSELHSVGALESEMEVLVQNNGIQIFESHILNNTSPLGSPTETYSSCLF